MTRERDPKFCGGQNISINLVEWPSRSDIDEFNTITLNEHQCNDCGSKSFWT